LSEVYIENPGVGYAYTNPPSISFFGGGGYGANAIVGVSSRGSIGIVTITSPGQGYVTPPTITFSSPLGLGATVTAQIGAGGTVTGLTLVQGGEFYSSAPTITIDPPGTVGTTAILSAVVSGGSITDTTILNAGRFYRQDQDPVVTYDYIVGYANTIASVADANALYPDEVNGPFGPGDPSGFLDFYYPGSSINDAVFDQTLNELWIYDGGAWNIGDPVFVGSATTVAVVSTASTISSIITPTILDTILNGTEVDVTIDAPTGTGLDPDFRAFATLTISNGSVNSVTLTNPGVGYTVAPNVVIPNTSQYKTQVGLVTATAQAFLNSSGGISTVRITNSGYGYVDPPTITISEGTQIGTGNFIFGEIVTGSISNSSGTVKNWNSLTKKLEISGLGTDFVVGDVISGQTSNAVYSLFKYETFDLDSAYDNNDVIEEEADLILDFSEVNPFGEV